jgi:hypothetical protein
MVFFGDVSLTQERISGVFPILSFLSFFLVALFPLEVFFS